MIKKFEEIRILHKENKTKFAESIGLSPYQYSKMISATNKKRLIHIDEVCKLVSKYNINLNWLLFDSEEMHAINNGFDSALKKLINNTNKQFNDDSFVTKLLINHLLDNIDLKINIKDGLNQRPLFMLRKILKDEETNWDKQNYKNSILEKIKNAKDPFEKTNQMLHYKIDKLTDDECFFIIENRIIFVKMLEQKVNKLDLIAWDFKEKIKNYFKSF
ncbi:hypothetical protein [Aliarcobacter skirrowii]|uniref:HTH cro/C1-type domain-containing protein n=1 Tax=Aliarcobacter skirrowii TaxID=28200 RepID=A0AAW9DCE0_9BACT|nr:hypothetical protein [Aliarcobacter skirrowii]MDX4069938.1 hypothetical protein [Aliarcobacter skirrowii]